MVAVDSSCWWGEATRLHCAIRQFQPPAVKYLQSPQCATRWANQGNITEHNPLAYSIKPRKKHVRHAEVLIRNEPRKGEKLELELLQQLQWLKTTPTFRSAAAQNCTTEKTIFSVFLPDLGQCARPALPKSSRLRERADTNLTSYFGQLRWKL